MEIDIDIEDLEKINDPLARNILNQFRLNGYSVHSDNKFNHRVSTALRKSRKKKIIVVGPDRRSDLHFIAVNPNIKNADKVLASEFKHLIKEFR